MVKELYEKGADDTCCDCNGYKAVDLGIDSTNLLFDLKILNKLFLKSFFSC